MRSMFHAGQPDDIVHLETTSNTRSQSGCPWCKAE
jgi:hypothetical protein